ncbi:hypothetical protein CI109_106447 [Kwoniella shandongensis]|uniref:Uncharacterized protein n=1 Tax=Kwoniella shandongensis TaxID=1734106 RepID=A0A5M6C516_9TREE|nr:uncharacterized protein CI109_002629 [Kwoniella shandongensis]KAA5528872.1 hypothetical protein CI109_002629 [Kwoniella shandongensis]
MPPTPPHDAPSSTVLPTATSQQNTRALLRSLEELRDSLGSRVEQLGVAVERLRGQAGDLERALEGDLGGPSSPGTTIRQQSRLYQSTLNEYQAPQAPRSPTTSSQAPAAILQPSAIGAELSSLSRPVTNDEIHSLLDRASQPTSRSSDPWTVRAQTIENRITRLSETARDLRMRASRSLVEPVGGNNITPSGPPPGTRARWPTPGPSSGANEPTADNENGSGLSRLLTRVREDQDRLEAGIQRLNNAGVGTSRIAPSPYRHDLRANRIPTLGETSTSQTTGSDGNVAHIIRDPPAPAMTRREMSRMSGETSRSRSRGLAPTNTRLLARQPAPVVVKSTTVSPIAPTSFHSETPPPQHTFTAPAATTAVVPDAALSLTVHQVSRNNDRLMDMARELVRGANEASRTNDVPSLATITHNSNANDITRADNLRQDGLTYRGMSVASRMGEGTSPSTSQRPPRRHHLDTLGEDQDAFFSLWPSLRQLFEQIPLSGHAGAIDQTRETPLENRIRSMQSASVAVDSGHDRSNGQLHQRNPDNEFRSFLLDLNGDEGSATRTRTGDYMSAMGGAIQGSSSGSEGGSEGDEHGSTSVVVIDLTVDPPQYISRRLPPRNTTNVDDVVDARHLRDPTSTSTITRSRPRPAEEAERIRAERDAANERIERSRQSLRRIQQLRRDMNLIRTGAPSTNSASPLQVEIGVEEPGLTPTQGISAAGAMDRDGEVDLMRALVIDEGSEDEGADTVFEGEGERMEGTQAAARRTSSGTRPAREQVEPPKETFDCDFHLWPTNGPVTRAGEGRVYGSLSGR